MASISKIPDDKLLTRREAAEFLTLRGYPIKAATLARKASCGGGPRFVIFNRRALYRPADLLLWAEGATELPPSAPSFS